MIGFIIRTIVIAIGVAVVAYFYPSISYGDDLQTLAVVAVILGLLNAFVKPILKIFAIPLNMMTLGLFGIVINAALLIAVAFIADLVGFTFVVGGFPPDFSFSTVVAAVVGAIGISHRRHDRRHGGPGLTIAASVEALDDEDRRRAARRRTSTHAGLRHGSWRLGRGVRRGPRRLSRPDRPPVLGQGERHAGDHPRGLRPRIRGQRGLARGVGRRPAGGRAERTDHPGGRRQVDRRPARRGPSRRATAIPCCGSRWSHRRRRRPCGASAGASRRATRRAVPAQPGRRAGDARRPRRRGRRQQVRDGRDGDRGGHRGRRWRRTAPCGHAGSTSTWGRSSAPWMRGATPFARAWP